MRYLISGLLLLTVNLSLCQEWEDLEFMDSIAQEYPDYRLVYLNDNYQIRSFTFYDEHITLLLAKWEQEYPDVHFLLVDPYSRLTLDTLTFQKTLLPLIERSFYYNLRKDSIYFRPLAGFIPENNKSYFNRLSLTIPVRQNHFLPYQLTIDGEKSESNIFLHFLNPKNLRINTQKKRIELQLNSEIQATYDSRKIPTELRKKEMVFYKEYFPYVISSKQAIVLDLLGDQLIFANKSSHKKQKLLKVENLKGNDLRYRLLLDEGYQNLYLLIERGAKSELFKLIDNEFKPLNVKLPRPWDYDSLGSNHPTPIFINNGKLFTVLNIKYEGRELDAVFMTVL